jgi:hypothetical protein
MNQHAVFNDAVRIVTEELTPDSAKIIRYALQNKKTPAFKSHQRFFGVAFRNLLAERGIVWEEAIVYGVWFSVLQQSITKILE